MSERDQSPLEQFAPSTDLELDAGIRRAVLILRSAGVETFESCEGGPGHAFPDPTIKFHGGAWAGYRALRIQLGRVLEMAESSPDKFVYENKIAERFGGQKELELVVPTPSTVTPSGMRTD
jgi:hypothetical protein